MPDMSINKRVLDQINSYDMEFEKLIIDDKNRNIKHIKLFTSDVANPNFGNPAHWKLIEEFLFFQNSIWVKHPSAKD